MLSKKSFFVSLLIVATSPSLSAQFQLPQFDVELKAQQNIIPFGGGEYLNYFETTNFYGGAHIQISQRLAVGGFYSKSFRGTERFSYKTGSIYKDALLQTKGIDIRFSAGRAKNWRKYITLNYSKIEMVEDNMGYRLANKTSAFGGSLGIMRRLSNKLYLTVMELGFKAMKEEVFWFGRSEKYILDARMGLLYNIGKRR